MGFLKAKTTANDVLAVYPSFGSVGDLTITQQTFTITLVIELLQLLGDHFDNHDDNALNFGGREVHYIIVHRSITVHCRITENAAMVLGQNHKIASRS